MHHHSLHTKKYGFTLIELLIVIGILAILSVVLVLILNPVELLRQSRDSNRFSDMDTLAHALSIYSVDSINGSGNSSTVYISIPDPAATSTAGDQCQGLGLPVPASGWAYHCAASSTYRNVDGTGWIPVNFTNASWRSPLGALPVDPINTLASCSYYTYVSNGSGYEVSALPESNKYQGVAAADGGPIAELYEKGTSFGLVPADCGISVIQAVQGSTGGGTMVSLNFTKPSTAGDLIVVGINDGGGAISSVTDNLSQSYAIALSTTTGNGSGIAVYYKQNTAAGVTSVIVTGVYGNICANGGEYLGINTSTALDQIVLNDNGYNSGLAFTSGRTAAIAQPKELLWGYATQVQADSVTFNPGTGWNARPSTPCSFSEDRIVSTGGQYAATGTIVDAGTGYQIFGIIATFRHW